MTYSRLYRRISRHIAERNAWLAGDPWDVEPGHDLRPADLGLATMPDADLTVPRLVSPGALAAALAPIAGAPLREVGAPLVRADLRQVRLGAP